MKQNEVWQAAAKTPQSPNMRTAAAVILCGGGSRRMRGVPKQNLKLGETTFLERLYRTLDCFDERLISINEELPGYITVQDYYKGIGPIGGIHAALCHTKKDVLFVAACDMPNLSYELIESLFARLGEQEDCLVPVLNGRVHPLCAIYRKSILPEIERQIHMKNYRMMSLLERANTHYLSVPERFDSALSNINTPEMYHTLCQRDNGATTKQNNNN